MSKPKVYFARNYGSTNETKDTIPEAITQDSSGVYLTGNFDGTSINFGGHVLIRKSSDGYNDTYLVKLSKDGQVQYAQNYGSTNETRDTLPIAITQDSSGVYLTGNFDGTSINFGGHVLERKSIGYINDTYLVKLSKDGQVQYAQNYGSTNEAKGTTPNAITQDSSGVYLTGNFQGTSLNFGGHELIRKSTSVDTYLVKLSKDGQVQYAQNYGSTNEAKDTIPEAITQDSSGVYLTGYFNGTSINFGGHELIRKSTGSANDTYLVKLSKDGQVQYAQNYGSTNEAKDTIPEAITQDSSGVYLTGYFNGTSINFGGHELIRKSTGSANDTYLVKLSKDGQVQYAQNYGSTNEAKSIFPRSITQDSSGVYLTGYFAGTSINFGGHELIRKSTGSANDNYLVKLSKDGQVQYAQNYGSTNEAKSTIPYAITQDSSGVYLTGYFAGTSINFGGHELIRKSTKNDTYLVKLSKYT